MALKFTPDGKVSDKWPCPHGHYGGDCAECVKELTAALDDCMAALRIFANAQDEAPFWIKKNAAIALRKIGAEP